MPTSFSAALISLIHTSSFHHILTGHHASLRSLNMNMNMFIAITRCLLPGSGAKAMRWAPYVFNFNKEKVLVGVILKYFVFYSNTVSMSNVRSPTHYCPILGRGSYRREREAFWVGVSGEITSENSNFYPSSFLSLHCYCTYSPSLLFAHTEFLC